MLEEHEVWTDGKRTLYHGDSRELLRLMPRESFDAIVTDPPWGEGLVAGDDNPLHAELLACDVLKAAKPLLKPGAHVAMFWSSRSVDHAINAIHDAGFIFCRMLNMHVQQGGGRPYPSNGGWLAKTQPILLAREAGRAIPNWRLAPARLLRAAMDVKGYSATRLAKELKCDTRLVTKWIREHDEAWSYPNDRHRIAISQILAVELPEPPEPPDRRSVRSDLYMVESGKPESSHPCEKPLWVVEDIISRLGTSILDPFAGSATTLVAARKLGVKCVGVEVDSCHAALGRLAQKEFCF